jgi:glucose/arabinose dehydrogenase
VKAGRAQNVDQTVRERSKEATRRTSRDRTPFTLLLALAILALGLIAPPSAPAAPPENFQTSLVLGDGLDGPSGFDIAPDGRIFILERSGKIKIVKNGQLLPTPFADLP